MSRPLALSQPLFMRVLTLAFALSLLLPAAALAHDASSTAALDDTGSKTSSYREEAFGMQKKMPEGGEVEVEPDLLVLLDPRDTFESDLMVLPDPWTGFPDVAAEVENAGEPEKVWYVADDWLNYVVGEGLMSGYVINGFFGPYDNITRGQVAVILYRAECAKSPTLIEEYGSTTDPAKYACDCAFDDMRASDYCTAALNWAKDEGILTGDAATNYTTVRPDDPVTRQELCLMLARHVNGGETRETRLDSAKAKGILDMEEIAHWARGGVYWAVNNGVISGVDNGDDTFSMDPTGNTWRSAAAKMLTVVMRNMM